MQGTNSYISHGSMLHPTNSKQRGYRNCTHLHQFPLIFSIPTRSRGFSPTCPHNFIPIPSPHKYSCSHPHNPHYHHTILIKCRIGQPTIRYGYITVGTIYPLAVIHLHCTVCNVKFIVLHSIYWKTVNNSSITSTTVLLLCCNYQCFSLFPLYYCHFTIPTVIPQHFYFTITAVITTVTAVIQNSLPIPHHSLVEMTSTYIYTAVTSK